MRFIPLSTWITSLGIVLGTAVADAAQVNYVVIFTTSYYEGAPYNLPFPKLTGTVTFDDARLQPNGFAAATSFHFSDGQYEWTPADLDPGTDLIGVLDSNGSPAAIYPGALSTAESTHNIYGPGSIFAPPSNPPTVELAFEGPTDIQHCAPFFCSGFKVSFPGLVDPDPRVYGRYHGYAVFQRIFDVVPVGPVCDVNGDNFVDRSDIDAIFAARGQPASSSSDPRDADGDGQITVLDGRTCTLQCGNPDCAPKPVAACGLVGLEALAPALLLAWRRRHARAAAKRKTQ